MKACMVLFDSELNEEVFMLMKLAKIVNFTLFKGLHGSGKQGKKEGSVTWPGANEIMLMLVNDEELDIFKKVVKEFKENKGGHTGLLFFNWELSEFII